MQIRTSVNMPSWTSPIVGSAIKYLEAPIFRAPVRIRDGRKTDFEPKLVSIGPYFHGREQLVPMEQLKPKFISEFLLALRTSQPVDPVPVDPFRQMVGDVRHCYKEKVEYSDDAFLQILVRDSLFIIGIILLFQEKIPMTFKDEYALKEMNIKGIISDLLLLENQIPLVFIKKVYDWISDRMEGPKFAFEIIIKPFIGFDMPWRFNENDTEGAGHLLELYWRCSLSPEIIERMLKFQRIQPAGPAPVWTRYWSKSFHPINVRTAMLNATALRNMANIKFKEHSEDLDVHFSEGIMHMPCLILDSNQTRILANLVAFEYSKLSSERIFHNYIKLMGELVDSKNDVKLLRQCGIIYDKLSSRKSVATFFNDIGNYCLVDINQHLFSDLYKDVQKYYSSYWNQQRAILQLTYFRDPWTLFSVVLVGLTALALSAVQTVYTVNAYIHPRQ